MQKKKKTNSLVFGELVDENIMNHSLERRFGSEVTTREGIINYDGLWTFESAVRCQMECVRPHT